MAASTSRRRTADRMVNCKESRSLIFMIAVFCPVGRGIDPVGRGVDPVVLIFSQDIAHSDHRVNKSRVESFVDLGPEIIDIDIDQVSAAVIIDTPDRFRDMGPGEHPVFVDDQ